MEPRTGEELNQEAQELTLVQDQVKDSLFWMHKYEQLCSIFEANSRANYVLAFPGLGDQVF